MKRNGEIDLLKFLFSLMIVIYHTKNFTEYYGQNLFMQGSIGVSFFFLVSGYLLAYSTGKIQLESKDAVGPQAVKFVERKIKGLLPNVYVAWIIAFIVEVWVVRGGTI